MGGKCREDTGLGNTSHEKIEGNLKWNLDLIFVHVDVSILSILCPFPVGVRSSSGGGQGSWPWVGGMLESRRCFACLDCPLVLLLDHYSGVSEVALSEGRVRYSAGARTVGE